MVDNPDIKELLDLFDKCKVQFVLIGGYAVMHYTEPRYTKDIDLLVSSKSPNAQAIVQALKEFGVPESELKLELFSSEGNFYKIGRPPWRVDIMTSAEPLSFEQIWQDSTEIEFGERKIRIVSRQHLIALKEYAARPQDLLDLEKLTLSR